VNHFLYKLSKASAFITLPQWVWRESDVLALSSHLRQKLLSEKADVTLAAASSEIEKVRAVYVQVLKSRLPFFGKCVGRKPDLDTFLWPVEIRWTAGVFTG
jgi:hypothetical protein